MEGRHGAIVAPDDSFIEFPDGIPGFVEETSWVVVGGTDSPLAWLQSTDTPSVALPVTIPWAFHWSFEVKVSDEELAQIELDRAEDVEVLAVVNVPREPKRATINLFAPIIVNRRLMLGRQVTNLMPGYSCRDPLVARAVGRPVAIHGWDFPMAVRA